MKLSVLATKGHRLLSLVAAVDVFATANRFLEIEGEKPFFEIQIIGQSDHSVLAESFRDYPFFDISNPNLKSDVIIVPAFANREMQENIGNNIRFIPFLHENYQNGASLVSLCTGSFLLAASGLLNGKSATTHLEASDKFEAAFPEVNLQPHAIITENENIYTSGGATSSFHLKLHLIQKFCGREIAVRVAKNFAIDLDRNNQLYFDQFKPDLVEDDDLVCMVQKLINEKYSEIKTVEEALEVVPSSRRNIIRRFKQKTGITPIRYLQKTKIEAAKNLLETTNKDILEVMVSCGYNDMKNFRQLFKSLTGLTPKGYRDKYGMRLS
ncbi:GlxA family transcriptional regulator [Moheibacter sp.]|uniref:GlxA family transcriptional regulator n=1 Tax=Moheibacter sp. TaxID=1965316 RepID=UPI003C7270E9